MSTLKRPRSPSPPTFLTDTDATPLSRPVRTFPRRRLGSPLRISPKPVLRQSLREYRGYTTHETDHDDLNNDDDTDVEIGTGLSDAEPSVASSPDYLDRDSDDVDASLAASPLASKRRSNKAVDPLEYTGSRKRYLVSEKSRRPSALLIPSRRVISATESILTITRCMDGLASSDPADEDDEDLVSLVVIPGNDELVTTSPTPRSPSVDYRDLQSDINMSSPSSVESVIAVMPRPLARKRKSKSAAARRQTHNRRRAFDKMALNASATVPTFPIDLPELLPSVRSSSPTTIVDSSPYLTGPSPPPLPTLATKSLRILSALAMSDSDIDESDVEHLDEFLVNESLETSPSATAAMRADAARAKGNAEALNRARAVQLAKLDIPRRSKHRRAPERRASQADTSHLHRRSPTSLLPRREKRRHASRTHSKWHVALKRRPVSSFLYAGPIVSGAQSATAIRSRVKRYIKRRDALLLFNVRHEHGAWRAMVGKWVGYNEVVRNTRPWWLSCATEDSRTTEPIIVDPEDVTIVKFQTIVREGKEIVVGRIKVPTPGNDDLHAFILRRYDTDAISLTTMYKAAFPGASDEDEKREMDWVRSSYDTRNTNGGGDCNAVRLAGQWVSRHLAVHLAPAYGILSLVIALSKAAPDPNVSYRKSQCSQSASDDLARQRAAGSDVRPAPSMATESNEVPTPKRQRRVEGKTEPIILDPILFDPEPNIASDVEIEVDESEVEGLLANVTDDVEAAIASNTSFKSDDTDTIPSQSQKRKIDLVSPGEEEVSTRWARRNEIRLGDEIKPHIYLLKARSMARRQVERMHETRTAQEAVRVAHREVLCEAAQQVARVRQCVQNRAPNRQAIAGQAPVSFPAPILDLRPPIDIVTAPDITLTSTTSIRPVESHSSSLLPASPAVSNLSDPPEYEFPFYPVVPHRHSAHLVSPSTPSSQRRAADRVSGLLNSPAPAYLPNQYTRRSPSPPPPYNATTDRMTLIAPVFTEEDDEDAQIAAIVLAPSPRRDQRLVGAFPRSGISVPYVHLASRHGARTSPWENPVVSSSAAWDAAIDLEEGDAVESAVSADVEDSVDGVHLAVNARGVLGPIGRWLGGIWRW